MKPVIQEEVTGCAIAASAAIAGISYKEAKRVANSIGINADDPSLWSDIEPIRRLLNSIGIRTAGKQKPFIGWSALPPCALLATKWHVKRGQPFWHWTVFVRENNREYILDSKKALKSHTRTDFGRITPKWYIEVFD